MQGWQMAGGMHRALLLGRTGGIEWLITGSVSQSVPILAISSSQILVSSSIS